MLMGNYYKSKTKHMIVIILMMTCIFMRGLCYGMYIGKKV